MWRNIGLGCLSVLISTAVVGHAYYHKKQFYPTMVYITKSNPSLAILYVQALIMVLLIGKLCRRIFLGELRAAEFEHLVERSWYAVTETCLAFTVFKDDFNLRFVALFTVLLFLKSFHWLAEDRVDFMERSPVISWLFHVRIVLLLSLLGSADIYFIYVAYYSTLIKGASVQLVFGFEYAILFTVVFNISLKYVLHTVDISRDVFWENKAVFLLHMELLIGFLKVSLYVAFVILMIKLYTLPLFIFRPMYYTLRSFKRALHDVIMSRRAIRNMNTLYPDATPEELAAGDNVCIICREEMHTSSKKLPCNHIFHTSCLRSWFQRHQTCPTCRLNILRPAPDGQQHTAPAAAGPEAPPPNQPPQPPFGFPWQPFFLPFRPPNLENIPPNVRDIGQQPPPTQQQSQQQQQQEQQQQQQMPEFTQSYFNGPNSRINFSSPTFPFPFLFPPMPLIPGISNPPLPPQNWSGLTDEELRQMEETGRRGIEARLQCLRNIQCLMDASVILMQQYISSASVASAAAASSTSNVTNSSSSSTVPPAPAASSNGDAPKASTSDVPSSSTSFSEFSRPSTSVFDQQSTSGIKNTATSTLDEAASNKSNRDEDTFQNHSSTQSFLSEQEIIRRRRIEKLDKNATTSNGSS